MKVNVNVELVDYEDKPLVLDGSTLTLKRVLISALNMVDRNKPTAPPIERQLRNYALSVEISHNEEVNLEAEDIVLIKRNVNLIYSPLVVGQVVKLIDPV